MSEVTKVIICFTPFVAIENVIPLAPALLKSCLMESGIKTKTIDYNNLLFIDFMAATAATCGNDTANDDKIKLGNWLMSPWTEIDENIKNTYLSIVQRYANELVDQNIEWIAFSSFSYQSHQFIEDITQRIKAIDPSQKIMIGGSNIDIFKKGNNKRWVDHMLDSGLADAACLGEGETVIAKIVNDDLRGIVVSKQLSNLDFLEVPVPNFDDYIFENYGGVDAIQVPITASKGCVRACTFCDVAAMWPKFRYRTGESVANEIITLHKKHGFTNFRFTDSLINGGLKPFRQMNQILSEQLPNTVTYWGQFICRSERDMPPKDFDLMKSGGCRWVNIGIESGSESVRDHMKKNFTNEDIDYTAEQLLRVGIKQQWNIFVGYPTETEEDFQDTLNLLKKYSKYNDMVLISPIGLFKMINGTPITTDYYMGELGVSVQEFNGNNDIIWTTDINTENTFETRYNRWKRLLKALEENGQIGLYSNSQVLKHRDKEIDNFMNHYRKRNER